MPALLPDVDIDTSILEALDFDVTPKCDNDTCERDATHTIRCHCRRGVEFSCFQCVTEILAEPLAIIKFDPQKSCGHLSSLHVCEIAPL